jgi:hypothetical protein
MVRFFTDLGMHASEVVQLQLVASTGKKSIQLPMGKLRRGSVLPLTDKTGRAIVNYLRRTPTNQKPRCLCSALRSLRCTDRPRRHSARGSGSLPALRLGTFARTHSSPQNGVDVAQPGLAVEGNRGRAWPSQPRYLDDLYEGRLAPAGGGRSALVREAAMTTSRSLQSLVQCTSTSGTALDLLWKFQASS